LDTPEYNLEQADKMRRDNRADLATYYALRALVLQLQQKTVAPKPTMPAVTTVETPIIEAPASTIEEKKSKRKTPVESP